jgi:hypothetical protein
MEEWIRNHFGKDAVETWMVNDIKLSPLLDQDLNSFRMTIGSYSDNLLLFSVIMHRYCPELLQFPYDSGRSIDPETDRYAADIASRYPRKPAPPVRKTHSFTYNCLENTPTSARKNQRLPNVQKKYLELFHSDSFQRDFRLFAGVEMDRALRMDMIRKKHNPLCHVYSSTAIVTMIRAVWASRGGHGSDRLCDRPQKTAFSPRLRMERQMMKLYALIRTRFKRHNIL